MSLELILEDYPKEIRLKEGFQCTLRPLTASDELAFHEFFLAVPTQELIFLKHRVTEPEVIQGWCQTIDYGRNLPLLAMYNGQVIGDATLHQQLGGWRRNIGRASVFVHPKFRGRGLAKTMITELIDIAQQAGLERLEAEFIGEQEAAMKMFAMLGFGTLARLKNYVKDMETVAHDYVLMGLELKTDEEYAGMG